MSVFCQTGAAVTLLRVLPFASDAAIVLQSRRTDAHVCLQTRLVLGTKPRLDR